MNNETNIEFKPAPLKDRMTVYVGALVVILASWLYIIGMGWHMNTLPFFDNPSAMNMDMGMDKKPMDMGMDKKPMDMGMHVNSDMTLVNKILSWMPPSQGAWALTDFTLLFLMWSVMMIAMMTPSILPMLLLFTTLNSKNRDNGKETSSTMILLSGYLFSWVLFSLVITFPQYAMHKSGLLNPMMEPSHAYLGTIMLCLAGIYQFTPFKDACLSVCQSPLSFLMNNWKDGSIGTFIIGYKHGFYCIGCCWALMMTLFALGVMNIMWVMILTLFVLFEKLAYKRPILFRQTTGIFFIAWGILLVV
jgi:predicted metal-binding membrane protein